MFKIVTLGAVGLMATSLVLFAPPVLAAGAADEGMADFFANTLVVSVPSAPWVDKRYLSPDHTYRDEGDSGDQRGTWVIEGGKLCVTPEKPSKYGAPRYCNPGPGKKLGEFWNDEDPITGNTVVFALTPGR